MLDSDVPCTKPFQNTLPTAPKIHICYTQSRRRGFKVMLHEPIFNPCYTRQLLTQLCCSNGMLHETILTQHCSQHLNPGSCSTNMADNELRRRRLKIIQVLLLVDELEEGKGRNRERIISTRIWIRRREERGVYYQLIRELALDDVALKVSGKGVTRTNTNKIRATMLQVLESLSKPCNMLLQQNVALKIALCTLLHEANF